MDTAPFWCPAAAEVRGGRKARRLGVERTIAASQPQFPSGASALQQRMQCTPDANEATQGANGTLACRTQRHLLLWAAQQAAKFSGCRLDLILQPIVLQSKSTAACIKAARLPRQRLCGKNLEPWPPSSLPSSASSPHPAQRPSSNHAAGAAWRWLSAARGSGKASRRRRRQSRRPGEALQWPPPRTGFPPTLCSRKQDPCTYN